MSKLSRQILFSLIMVWAALIACQLTPVNNNRTFSLGNY
jgi:hypothetical protein